MSKDQEKPVTEEPQSVSLPEFFETIPPSRTITVRDIAAIPRASDRPRFQTPQIQLHCDSEPCNGVRFFSCTSEAPFLTADEWTHRFLTYACRNCGTKRKTFAVAIRLERGTMNGLLFKYGESPSFGPPTPARVITLIGPDRDLFLMGRRCENQGLGIGAFVYYRRVVENQKNRMLDEITRVGQKIGASQELLKELAVAKNETQFSRAIDSIKHAIPQVLLVNGHNPLSLLHAALSEGVHVQTDAECLSLATSIRVVLTELAERLGQALKDEAELNDAISRLLSAKTKKGDGG